MEREYEYCSSFSNIPMTNAQITLALIYSFSKLIETKKVKKSVAIKTHYQCLFKLKIEQINQI
jgi:hypothetical protein